MLYIIMVILLLIIYFWISSYWNLKDKSYNTIKNLPCHNDKWTHDSNGTFYFKFQNDRS